MNPFHGLTSSVPPSGGGFRANGEVQTERRCSMTRPTTRPASCPVRLAGAGPVTIMPDSGGATFRGAGPIWNGRCRVLRRTRPSCGHTPCPGSPEAPSGRPGVPLLRCPPAPVPATGRHPRAPARWWRTATARPAAYAPAPRSPACATARRGRSRNPGTTRTARSPAGVAASARPSARGACAAWRCRTCRSPGRGRRPRSRRAPAPAPPCWPAAACCAAPCRRARRPASARRSGRSREAGPAPPRGGCSPGPPAACQRAHRPDPLRAAHPSGRLFPDRAPPSGEPGRREAGRHPREGRRGPGPTPRNLRLPRPGHLQLRGHQLQPIQHAPDLPRAGSGGSGVP